MEAQSSLIILVFKATPQISGTSPAFHHRRPGSGQAM